MTRSVSTLTLNAPQTLSALLTARDKLLAIVAVVNQMVDGATALATLQQRTPTPRATGRPRRLTAHNTARGSIRNAIRGAFRRIATPGTRITPQALYDAMPTKPKDRQHVCAFLSAGVEAGTLTREGRGVYRVK